MIYYFLFACLLTAALVPLVKRLAWKTGAVDHPTHPRKIHTKPTPLLGGLAVAISFALWLVVYLQYGQVNMNVLPAKFFYAILGALVVLMIGGFLDDKYQLPAKITWIFPAFASLIIVLSGIGVGITFISNPLGGVIPLNYMLIGLPLSGILAFLWLMGTTYTTKIMDGMDGLVSGIGVIAAFTLFFVSLTPKVNQPMTATLSLILAGSLLGFLFYNFNPASIFLGEGGSTMVGFLLGVLSIILGAKIATALLVMGIPILDVAWAIVRRLWGRSSPFVGDRQHLHFRLLDIGLTQRQAVYVLWAISAVFGATALFMQSKGKFIALLVLFCVMLGLIILTAVLYRKMAQKSK